MVNYSANEANESLEPPLSYPGATPDADRARQPALPEPPYLPHRQKTAPSEPPHKPGSANTCAPAPRTGSARDQRDKMDSRSRG
jgi:hypothetical protein